MLNLRTHKILISHDVIWMNRLFGDDDNTPQILPDDEEDVGDQLTEPDVIPSEHPTATPPTPPPNPPIPQLPRELRNPS